MKRWYSRIRKEGGAKGRNINCREVLSVEQVVGWRLLICEGPSMQGRQAVRSIKGRIKKGSTCDNW